MYAILGFVGGLVLVLGILVAIDHWLPRLPSRFPTDIDGDDTWHQW